MYLLCCWAVLGFAWEFFMSASFTLSEIKEQFELLHFHPWTSTLLKQAHFPKMTAWQHVPLSVPDMGNVLWKTELSYRTLSYSLHIQSALLHKEPESKSASRPTSVHQFTYTYWVHKNGTIQSWVTKSPLENPRPSLNCIWQKLWNINIITCLSFCCCCCFVPSPLKASEIM